MGITTFKCVNFFFHADIRECEDGSHNCDKHAYCFNTIGSYFCMCTEGYFGDGFTCTGKEENVPSGVSVTVHYV